MGFSTWLREWQQMEKLPDRGWKTEDPKLRILTCLTNKETDDVRRIREFQSKVRDLKETGNVNISRARSSPTYARDYQRCIGWIITGKTRAGERLALPAHQRAGDYISIVGSANSNDEKVMTGNIRRFLKQVEPGTVDAVMFGGAYPMTTSHDDKENRDIYRIAIRSIGTILAEELHFEPMVVAGPQLCPSSEIIPRYPVDAAFAFGEDGQAKLYILRKFQNQIETPPFLPSKVDEALKEINTRITTRPRPQEAV